eukprot:6340108-Pyramimonas_sp.AAC.1
MVPSSPQRLRIMTLPSALHTDRPAIPLNRRRSRPKERRAQQAIWRVVVRHWGIYPLRGCDWSAGGIFLLRGCDWSVGGYIPIEGLRPVRRRAYSY